ncbi:MAG: zinc-ribbon and DUF3426 domain-containing protein [Pseudomonadota bacterium]
MSAITQCPQCKTHFKVSPAQLQMHNGMVRCGHCQAAFNATEHMHEVPNPPVAPDTTIAPEQESELNQETAREEPQESTRELPEESVPELPQQPSPELLEEAQQQRGPDSASAEALTTETSASAQKSTFTADSTISANQTRRTHRGWWILGCLLLLIMLLAQAAYFFRVELAARLPGLKPALISYCKLLHCSVPLPHQADLMSIESSELEVADPAQANVITLNAILRNHADYAQAYPNLELALTDAADKVVARRIFVPAEYLAPENNEARGIAAEREASLKLRLDTTDLKPTGYRLFLFYPP